MLELAQLMLPQHGTLAVSVDMRPSVEAPSSALANRTRDAVLGVVMQADLAELTLSPWLQTLASDELLRQFKEVQRQLLYESEERGAFLASATGVASGLTVGYVIWLVRGGVLLSAMLSALPAWQLIDPLPVMTRASVAGGRRRSDDRSEAVERLFDRDAHATRRQPQFGTAAPADIAKATPDAAQPESRQ